VGTVISTCDGIHRRRLHAQDPPLELPVRRYSTAPGRAPELTARMERPAARRGAELNVVLLKPRSTGVVRLHSADPAEPPSIELPNLSDPSDIERLAEGYRRALEVVNRPSVGTAPTDHRVSRPTRLHCSRTSAHRCTRCPTSWGRVRWARDPTRVVWSTRPDAFTERKRSASPMRRSCRTCPQGLRTSRQS
jgi:choline dehydrogenase-like flavoprotein